MLLNCFFLTESHNPDLPEEEWTLVYENATPGAYSQNFGWGKYKVVISGGGGSGAAFIELSGAVFELKNCNNGSAATQTTTFVNVSAQQNKNFSGVVGGGGKGSYVVLQRGSSQWQGRASYGNVGTGYQNGATANTKYEYGHPLTDNSGAWVGGSGGGSTSLEIDGVLESVASGGNGGSVTINYNGNKISYGGTGGNGGTTAGTGSAGGARITIFATSNTSGTSGNGTDGYVRIYKSNLKPEPV